MRLKGNSSKGRDVFGGSEKKDTRLIGVLRFHEKKGTPMIAKAQPKFSLGQIVATPSAREALDKADQNASVFLNRHAHGYWGDLDDEDRQTNEVDLIDGSRILSAYRTSRGEKLWVITEAADESGHRAARTILLPSEY